YGIDVPPGATQIGATLDGTESSATDLDLYLFDCTAGECVLRDFGNGASSSERVGVNNPAGGKWKVVVDPFHTSGSAAFQYKDYFLHPAFGMVVSSGAPRLVPPGASVAEQISIKVSAAPLGPRQLEALVFVTSEPGPNTDRQKTADSLELYY